ncbi:MurR/RpiR family transcriptional regulator [Neorhizobium alkalisoli]|uniref:RpiR family transcriptional regulator n=1 Tax=Neorhizobium alkalisoli TaxID=528178 RepID=A0A561R8X3_9HYPH|nr:MurR/RpiR family transcriptional regulator [Neorhizobium alkalisoli]TWF59048.1 RpiR family transcriptional regulator [Neorhizobium alkalisoli]
MKRMTKRPLDRLGERLSTRMQKLSPGLKTVALYISENRELVLSQSALEIAAETNTSDATVIRAVQALGFEGLRDLKSELRTAIGGSLSSAEKMEATTKDLNEDLNAAISYVSDSHLEAAHCLSNEEGRASIMAAINLLSTAGRIAVFGIGASGILADYAARLLYRSGFPSYALNRTGIGLGEQLLSMSQGDVMIMMVQGSAHREGATAVSEAVRLNVPIILLTAVKTPAFQDRASVTILAPRGQTDRFPLHGAIMMYLETIVLGLATINAERSTKSLQRLNQFYTSVRKKNRKF